MNDKCVLVVGGAGYIGSHVCKALQMGGFTPVVYDNLSTGHSWAIQFGPAIVADLEDEPALLKAFQEVEPQAVIHLASLINVRDSIANPALYWENNLMGTLTLLKAMVKSNVRKLVFSSTAAVYGNPERLPIDEAHPKAPLNAYGKTKWAIEAMLQDFAHAHSLRFAALRYFNASGADPGGLIGEAHHPETHLIPLVIRTALGLQKELLMYGDDFPTQDGTAIRDYVHVADLADAHVRALQALEQETSLQLNLGTGKGYSVREIIRTVEQIGRQPVPVRLAPRLPHDSSMLVADPTKAMKILHWTPRMSDLPTIIQTAWNWELKRSSSKLILNELLSSGSVIKT